MSFKIIKLKNLIFNTGILRICSEEKFDSTKFLTFYDSVNSRLVSDVPVAIFIWRIDSTSLVKSLNDNGQSINTFSVAYDDQRYDETMWSSKVVQRYKTIIFRKIFIDGNEYIDESIKFLMSLILILPLFRLLC